MNNNDFSGQTFTWVLEDHPNMISTDHNNKCTQPQQQQALQPQPEPFALSDADLFQFLLGQEAQQAAETTIGSMHEQNNQVAYAMEEDSSSSSEIPKKRKQTSSNKPPASATSRLDFRPINDHVPESQLKAMSSKERRQLRNKISARNFRNRRKEYVGSLEEQLNQQKAENSQLKLELKWLKTKVDKLQKENDKLRVDMVLGGIGLPPTTANAQQPTPIFDNMPHTNSLLHPPSSSSSSSSSDESTLSSPPNLFTEFPDNWDFVLPETTNTNTDTYLSHALVPHWNINQVLSKETSNALSSNASAMFQQYPLLAPALMSIVLAHTMTMSTNELLATAKLSPSALLPATNHIQYNEKDPFAGSTIMTDKEAKAVWNILEPITLMKERKLYLTGEENKQVEEKQEDTSSATSTTNCKFTNAAINTYIAMTAFCPLVSLQHRLGRFLCEFAATHCTVTAADTPQQSMMANNQPQEEDPINKKFILCRQFQKAKRYIAACH
ncbi:uncharacterized protein B0P05DRAFT_586183 [Gilbertella persicaria]|uniref:BZIP domain-containing protein n=1 Tax=Rhizopus stolonifer TaxID=4846 RepID=A0A367JNK0_RHIST|nr:uncharacterized protein B0P05DRAFT_586183 [Gilbertella persicaria]KAI8082514.1 hypothetical protein B0P05DRAFT_586183 [Gilbertella persicaria]RCH91498.1 hypothetical protein CU098_003307 [Rhizopus stolonifer]